MKKKFLGLLLLGSLSLVGITWSQSVSLFQRLSRFRFDVFRRMHLPKYAPLKKGESLPHCLSGIILSTDCLETIQYLIDGGISVDTTNDKGQTRLYTAYSFNMAKLLIDNGASLNIKDSNGQTPLHTVSSVEMAQLFIDHGACIYAKDNQGNTPIETVSHHAELVDLFTKCRSNSMGKESVY